MASGLAYVVGEVYGASNCREEPALGVSKNNRKAGRTPKMYGKSLELRHAWCIAHSVAARNVDVASLVFCA